MRKVQLMLIRREFFDEIFPTGFTRSRKVRKSQITIICFLLSLLYINKTFLLLVTIFLKLSEFCFSFSLETELIVHISSMISLTIKVLQEKWKIFIDSEEYWCFWIILSHQKVQLLYVCPLEAWSGDVFQSKTSHSGNRSELMRIKFKTLTRKTVNKRENCAL